MACIVTDSLNYINKNFKGVKVVQIGAMDGFSFDDTRGHLEKFKWDEILVEPIPNVFAKLKTNLSHRNNCIFENSAITETDGMVKMLTVDENTINSNDLHPGYGGMSALFPLKNGFGTDYDRDIYVKDNLADILEVNGITLKTLIKKHDIKNIDVFITDAEGHDWMVFDQLDLKKYNPKFIRLEYVNLTDIEKNKVKQKLDDFGYIYEEGFDITAVRKDIHENIYTKLVIEDSLVKINNDIDNNTKKMNCTIVTGLWNINREGRDFNHYIEAFKRLLDVPQQLYIYIPKEYEYLVWEKRDKKNTVVKIYELDDIKHMYKPFWDQTQKIRKSKKWLKQADWLKQSPQATNKWYNPIVQSKMFLLNDVTIHNPFNSEYFFWVDAGITNTVPHGHFAHDNVLDKITKYSEPFLFLSYPYEANKEIHGFDFKAINKYAKTEVKYVCRGGLFGGHKTQINEANATYYSMLGSTLSGGYMGTEESIFSIMANIDPVSYRRYELDGNGLIVKFTENVLKDNINLVDIPKQAKSKFNPAIYNNMKNLKTNLYILTFNFPEQLQHTINSMEKTSELLSRPNLYLLDNSTNGEAKKQNQEICKKYNFTYIDNGGNIGINGGRQVAAEHFHASDADFYFFFEDDMTLNGPTEIGNFCRKGFRKYVPDLYKIVHKIMIKEKFDFLKLSFTEVYWDNNIQTSWYNVPQQVRTEYWPDYDQLPVTGSDQNSPRTIFNTINEVDGLLYITGDVFYCNWPMIVSREGNKKMFIDTKWANPYEQTWMSHMFQLTKKGDLKSSILLASPIWHERIHYYKPNERKEN
jgi:FkbM family methyltransferase